MKELEHKRNERLKTIALVGAITVDVVTGAMAIGGVKLFDNQQKEKTQIQLIEAELANLRSENRLLWGNVCRAQALTDLQTQGKTDISPNKKGLEACKKDSEQWITIFNQEPKSTPLPTSSFDPNGGN